ncbi:SRPBCC family protein [Kitasatospora sp. NPDC036755]|uniref:SRPBCC family protein n=1 Tax=Kitasatospora sp. NPDC036755 TaxID=3154600 RepID=UPI0033CEDC66
MALNFSVSAVISGDISAIWQTITDVASWPEWDEHYVKTGFEGPFVVGATGWNKPKGTPGEGGAPFTVDAVEVEKSFSTTTKMPMGKMCIDNRFEVLPDGRVEITRDVAVHGGFVPFFRAFFLKSTREEMVESLHFLEAEAKRRLEAGEVVK